MTWARLVFQGQVRAVPGNDEKEMMDSEVSS
jgi:hypothetical protein